MKKGLKISLWSMLTVNALIVSNSTIADDASINYNGEITQSSCKVEEAAGNTLTISMGKIEEFKFTEAGKKINRTETPFTLKGCPDRVTIQFDGTADSSSNKYLALNNKGQLGIADGYAFVVELLIDERYGWKSNDEMTWPTYSTGQLRHADPDKIMRLNLASSVVATRPSNRKAGSARGMFTFTFINP